MWEIKIEIQILLNLIFKLKKNIILLGNPKAALHKLGKCSTIELKSLGLDYLSCKYCKNKGNNFTKPK